MNFLALLISENQVVVARFPVLTEDDGYLRTNLSIKWIKVLPDY